MTARELDDVIAALAAQQHGHITRRDAIRAGMPPRMIDRRVASGEWIQAAPGVYRMRGAPDTWLGRLTAATMHLPGAVVSHEAAAALHRLPTFSPGPVTVSVAHESTRRSPVALVRQSTDLVADHRTAVRGLPVTTVARTLVDLARVCSVARLDHVVGEVIAAEVVSVGGLCACFDDVARRGKPGCRKMRTVLTERQPGYVPPASKAESLLLQVLRDAGLPRPVLQLAAPWPGATDERVDVAYPWAKLIIEVDSRRWHTRVKDFARDRARDNAAVLAGWRVIRVTWDDLVHRPQEVVRMIRSVLAAAA
jgi:very-short-patch-repair endonuclease